MTRFLRRRDDSAPRTQLEHPAQLLAATLLRAVAEDDPGRLWAALSLESQGLLEGRYALRAGIGLARAAGVGDGEGDARLAPVVAPLRATLLAELGGESGVAAMGVSLARVLSRARAYVLLLPEFGEERVVREDEWRPSYLLAFVCEEREWRLDLGLTALLSAEAELPDPVGKLR